MEPQKSGAGQVIGIIIIILIVILGGFYFWTMKSPTTTETMNIRVVPVTTPVSKSTLLGELNADQNTSIDAELSSIDSTLK